MMILLCPPGYAIILFYMTLLLQYGIQLFFKIWLSHPTLQNFLFLLSSPYLWNKTLDILVDLM